MEMDAIERRMMRSAQLKWLGYINLRNNHHSKSIERHEWTLSGRLIFVRARLRPTATTASDRCAL